MTTKVVTDDTLGVLGRRYHELFDRVRKGVLDPQAVLNGMQALIEGAAPTGTVVDLDADPHVPDGWEVRDGDQLPNRARGTIDLATAKFGLFLAKAQRKGAIGGEALRKELADEPVLGANALDFYLKNTHLIPEEWKGKYGGTIYRDRDGDLFVRCLSWGGGRWGWFYSWLDFDWRSDGPALVVAG